MDFDKHHFFSPIGWLEIIASTDAIVSLRIVSASKQPLKSNSQVINQCCKELEDYFNGERRSFDVKVMFNGTDYQNAIWKQLQTIPYNTTISYKTLSSMSGHPKSWRAAGNANGKNPIAIIIPCHRVITSNGKIGGYAYGVEIKKQLLSLERKNGTITKDY